MPKVGKLKAGLLKVVSPAGMGGFPVPNGAASVNIEVTVGTDKYCMTFAGTGDGSKFLVKDAPAGSCSSSGAGCGNNVREGAEACDGSDAVSCPGNCQPHCTCLGVTCGNGMLDSGEAYDPGLLSFCPSPTGGGTFNRGGAAAAVQVVNGGRGPC